jgi:antitoxin component of MazEF toxin-antitoxin module
MAEITIPLEIWQQLNLQVGDEVVFSLEGNELQLRP